MGSQEWTPATALREYVYASLVGKIHTAISFSGILRVINSTQHGSAEEALSPWPAADTAIRSSKKSNKMRGRSGRRPGSQLTTRPPSYHLSNATGLRTQLPFPNRYVTNLAMSMAGWIPAGNSTAGAGNYMSVQVNTTAGPFNQSGFSPTTGTGTYSFAFNGSLVQGYAVANNPMGLGSLIGLYTYYKVLEYEIEFEFTTQNVGDVFQAVLFPLGSEIVPSAVAGNVNLRILDEQPRASRCMVELSTPRSSRVVRLRQKVADCLEIRPSQWDNMPSTQLGSAPSAFGTESTAAFVGLFLQQLNGNANTAAIEWRCKLRQIVEFTDYISQIS
jgi:hypothetical protein